MPEFPRLPLAKIVLVSSGAQARLATAELAACPFWGFDTESKPTFKVGESSDGPHVVQFSSDAKAWVFQLADPECRAAVCALLALGGIPKVGFGLNDDSRRIAEKLGVAAQGIVDLNHLFHALGHRKDIGVKGAVATVFGQRFIKSKKASTSNWANPRLSEAQLVYAGNDAYGAARVYLSMPK